MNIKSYIGDKVFYGRVFRVALPIALSQLLVHCSSMIDSIMVSSIGMVTAVGNAHNITNLFHYIMYGIEAGVALFAAQFFGAKQYDDMAKSQGISLFLQFINCVFWILSIYTIGDKLLLFYLDDTNIAIDSLKYLRIECFAFIPIFISRTFKCQFSAMHKTNVLFIDAIAYLCFGVLFKFLCIFVFELGIKGIAIGDLLAETLCFIGILIYTFKTKPVFLLGLRKMFSFNLGYVKAVLIKIMPCAFNEVLFGFGQTLFNKAYGMLGTASMDAVYISSDILSMVLFAVWGYGDAVSILVGTILGRGRFDEAKQEAKYHLGLSFMIGLSLCIIMVFFSPTILSLYSIEDINSFNTCKQLLAVYGLKAFIRTFTYSMFCTLKAGGDSKMFNLLDSGIMYAVGIPIAFISVKLGIKDIVLLVLICQIEQVVRFFLTLKRYNSYKWVNNLTKLV